MRNMDLWFAEYALSHKHPVNKKIHYICVPLIALSLLGILWPVGFTHVVYANLASVFVVLSLAFYAWLSVRLAIAMFVFSMVMLSLIALYQHYSSIPVWETSIVVFILAWVGQFIGHIYEGQKPSFFKDIFFLLIGPAWVMYKLCPSPNRRLSKEKY
ncbi:hypothetical protein BGC07_07765 [Piscirickettsia litoralis]|uniref:DUF962 domain-containing protein n=1 Tax=Piscirickettsia litoralis TaxID=1891921 RepID=A0ABX3A595_9GAMM|nr:hypothetical protein BGC07_07765 [Piscirickettsia litoralis]